MKDLFCGNYGVIRGALKICQRSWHPKCYKASKLMDFWIACPENNEGVKWRKKKEETRFLNARKGDVLCSPFQCDYCWFANITKKDANHWFSDDVRKLAFIRRVNLDVMWSREPSTVANSFSTLLRAKKDSEDLGFKPQTINLGPWPVADTCGFQVAIEMLRHSQGKGNKFGEIHSV